MERAKFRWLRYASLLALGASTLSGAVAGERHRAWVAPPSDLWAAAAPDEWSDPAAAAVGAKATTAAPRSDAGSGKAGDQPAETGSIAPPDATAGTVAKAPGDGSDPVPGEQAPAAGDARKEHNTRAASREDPAVAEPAPVHRTGIDRDRKRAAPRHTVRRAHRSSRRAAARTSLMERIFGPPRRGAHVVSPGSIR
jgi:hypothetical protein